MPSYSKHYHHAPRKSLNQSTPQLQTVVPVLVGTTEQGESQVLPMLMSSEDQAAIAGLSAGIASIGSFAYTDDLQIARLSPGNEMDDKYLQDEPQMATFLPQTYTESRFEHSSVGNHHSKRLSRSHASDKPIKSALEPVEDFGTHDTELIKTSTKPPNKLSKSKKNREISHSSIEPSVSAPKDALVHRKRQHRRYPEFEEDYIYKRIDPSSTTKPRHPIPIASQSDEANEICTITRSHYPPPVEQQHSAPAHRHHHRRHHRTTNNLEAIDDTSPTPPKKANKKKHARPQSLSRSCPDCLASTSLSSTISSGTSTPSSQEAVDQEKQTHQHGLLGDAPFHETSNSTIRSLLPGERDSANPKSKRYALLGGLGGAAIGTLLFPGAGTALGPALGGALMGTLGGHEVGKQSVDPSGKGKNGRSGRG